MNIQAMSFMNGQAFAVSATSLVGQSLGKKRPDMAQAYSRYTRRVGMVVSIILALSFILFGKFIVSLYTDDLYVISKGAKILMLVALIQPFQSSQFILAGALRVREIQNCHNVFNRCLYVPVLLYCYKRPGTWAGSAWLALIADQLVRSLLVLLRFNQVSGRV